MVSKVKGNYCLEDNGLLGNFCGQQQKSISYETFLNNAINFAQEEL